MSSILRITVFVSVFIFSVIYCLKVIPERGNVTYTNEKYIEYLKFTIRRYGRKSGYYMNLEGSIKYSLADNVTVDIIFLEYLHNEYRRSFIEMHFNYCEFLKKDPYIGGMLVMKGLKCPLLKGEYHLMNMTVPTENFPNQFPFEKGGADIEVLTKNELIMKIVVYASFKNDIQKRRH